MNIIGKTTSLCPKCFKKIDADIIEKNGVSILRKECEKHGIFEHPHFWDDPEMYLYMSKLFRNITVEPDEYGFELTTRCNMHCPFCFTSADNTGDEWKKIEMSKKEILRTIKGMKDKTISFTGGEPTVREDLVEILNDVNKCGLRTAVLTNGLNLNKRYIGQLKDAGVDKIQLQFDSLNDNDYQKIRGQKCLDSKLDAISNLRKSNIHVNIFSMLAKDVNDDQVGDIIDFVIEHSDVIRAVMFSSLCYEGRYNEKLEKMSTSDIIETIENQTEIKKKDFMECTRFDVLFSNTIGHVLRTKSISPCDTICYLYVDSSNQQIPINRIINLHEISDIFEKNIENNLKILLALLNPMNLRKIIKNKKSIHHLLMISFSIVKNLVGRLFGKSYHLENIVGVLVTSFHNRYNVDLEFLRNCTIRVYDGNKFISFCEKNIRWNKNKNFPKIDNYEVK